MAQFDVNVQQPGGVNLPQNPVMDNSAAQALNTVTQAGGGMLTDFFGGRKQQQQLVQKQQIGNALADQEQKLSTIADAVDRGDISSSVGRMKARAITTQAIANNPLITNELREAHAGFMSAGGLGKTVAEGTEQEQAQAALRKSAQQAGWGNPSMNLDEQDRMSLAWQQFQYGQAQLGAAEKELQYKRSQIGYSKDQVDLASAKQSYVTGGINQQAARINLARNQAEYQAQSAVGSMVSAYGNKHIQELEQIKKAFDGHQIDAKTASFQIDNIMAGIKTQVASSMGGFGAQYTQNMISPLDDMSSSYKKYVNGEYEKTQLDNEVSNNLARASANITGDPTAAKVFATSSLAKNTLATIPALNKAVTNILSTNGDTSTKPSDLTRSDTQGKQDVKSYTTSVLAGIGKIQVGKVADKQQLTTEVNTHIDQVLKGINAYQLSVQNPSDYKQVVEMLSDPQFGWYMQNSQGIHSESATAAAQVLQRDYELTGVKLMREEYFNKLNDAMKSAGTGSNAVVSAYVPNLQKPEDKTMRMEKIVPVFQGSGVTFIPKDANPDSATLASARDLNRSVSPALNRMIRMDAHLAGSTDYKKVYEDHYSRVFDKSQQEDTSTNPQ